MRSDFEFETDWQLFRQRITAWQERYMERLIQEYTEIISKDAKASERFWELKERIREDSKSAWISMEMKRSYMIKYIAGLINDGVIEYNDLEGFSDGFLDRIRRHYDLIEE